MKSQDLEPTNIWALEKSFRLKAVLVMLVDQLGAESMVVDQKTETVEEGVWLVHRSDPELRAYLYVHGQKEGTAGVHLEYPKIAGTPPAFEYSENVGPDQLAEILAAHFDISQVKPLPWSSG